MGSILSVYDTAIRKSKVRWGSMQQPLHGPLKRPQTNTKGIWSLKETKECSYSLSWICSHTIHIKRGKAFQLYDKKVKHTIIRKILDKKLIWQEHSRKLTPRIIPRAGGTVRGAPFFREIRHAVKFLKILAIYLIERKNEF